jgi:FkbM family methyltransferase
MSGASYLSRAKAIFKKDPNGIFRKAKGVIHVGANIGQEAGLYDQYGLPVIWVEPNPEVFEVLRSNVKAYPHQIALQGLVTDVDNAEYPFHLANNGGESSSILDMHLHTEVWPDVKYERTIQLRSRTLPSLLKDNHIDLAGYDMLVMDTQGSELLILKGAAALLKDIRYIKTEVPNFESYKDCCQIEDLEAFLAPYGFREHSRHRFAKRRSTGSYFDIIYIRK